MMPLHPLPDGMLYVCTGGREFIDHAGNVYIREPVTLPEAERTPALPDPSLSAETLKFIEAEENWLSELPREHFSVFHISWSGMIGSHSSARNCGRLAGRAGDARPD